jgi:tight adherence protein C
MRVFHRVILHLAPRNKGANPETLEEIDLNLRRAGRPGDVTAEEFMAMGQTFAVSLGATGLLYGCLLTGFGGIATGLMGAIVGYFIPSLVLNEWVNARMTRMVLRLPYAVDVLALCLSSGATFIGAVEELVKEPNDEPLDEEFRVFLTELKLGKTRREALENLAYRCGIDLLDAVVLAIIQGEEQGVPISHILKREASHIRKVRLEKTDEKANKASTKILFPTMIIVVATLLMLFGSFIIKIIRGTVFTS